ncbi:MAG: sugar dehydrogenase complex small subunit [Pseudomonadota bacterium]
MSHAPVLPAVDLSRRQLLGGLFTATTISMTPWVAAIESPTTRIPPASPAFMALSRYLSERDDLSNSLGARMQAALQTQNPEFNAQTVALWQWIDSNRVLLRDLNTRLKTSMPNVMVIPSQVMQAWYMGVVGSGAQTRVVAYEYALNAQLVSDKLKPPTYSYGTHGSWTQNPTSFNLKLGPIHT